MAKPEESETERLRRELWVVNSERLRLRAELDEMRSYGMGGLLDLLRVGRRLLARVEVRLARARGRTGGARSSLAQGTRLPSRLTGSEFAALGRRRLRRPRPSGNGGEPRRGGSDAWLVPVLVDYFGRDGSTAMMARLAASPEIVADGKYPFERRYFTYLWRWSRLLERTDWPGALWGKEDVVSLSQDPSVPLLGPPPWFPRTLLDAPGEAGGPSEAAFGFAWGELSARAVAARPGETPRYYAEKHSNTWKVDRRELPEHRLIVMLRDPRDVQASIEAFEGIRPEASFAANLSRAGIDRLPALVERYRNRLRWIVGLAEDESALVVPFEELSADPDAAAARVAEYLGIEVPGRPADEEGLVSRHMTAKSGAVGRWRTDLDPGTAERLTRELGPELRALGFPED
jgi:hypothetical protein